MEHRQLGRTGVSVSKLCLGAMMFGAWGNPDHDESIRIIHRALDAGHQLHRHRRRLLAGRVGGDRRQGARRRPPRRRRARHQGPRPDGRGPEPAGQLAPLDHPGGRGLAAAPRHRLDRPLPDPPPRPGTDIDETLGALTDLVAPGQGPLHRLARPSPPSQIVEAQWVARDREPQRFVCEQPPYSILVRGIEADVLPTCAALRHGRHLVEPAGRRLAVGPVAQGRRAAGAPRAPSGFPQRYDLSLPAQPAQARRRRRSSRSSPTRPGIPLDPAGDRLRRSTTRRSPRRSSGRAPWSSSRASCRPPTSSSTTAVLDRIDEIVPPGTNINPADAGALVANPALEPAARRR